MAGAAFDRRYNDGKNPSEEWGLDGWTEEQLFKLLLTGENNAAISYLNTEQCSMLAATLIEHVKEVSNDTQKDVT